LPTVHRYFPELTFEKLDFRLRTHYGLVGGNSISTRNALLIELNRSRKTTCLKTSAWIQVANRSKYACKACQWHVTRRGATLRFIFLNRNTFPLMRISKKSNLLGHTAGFTPQIGALVSVMTWTRMELLRSVKGMTRRDLDHAFDRKANTIGALLLHLAATEAFYQMSTLEGIPGVGWPARVKQKWDIAMNLGGPGRAIKGQSLAFYARVLTEMRKKTLAGFRKKDDAWLMYVDKRFPDPTNNYCKWFHVCEHEAHHKGQIKFLAERLSKA
jgi:Protein of unknown function (DUF664)